VPLDPLLQLLGPPVQIAYVVADVRAAAAQWAQRWGAGPFFVREHIDVHDVVYRGQPGVFDHSSAYGQWGQVMVELVQDHGPGPSAVRDMYAPGESGLHHLAYFVDDLDATTARLVADGYELAMSAASGGGVRFHFLDARHSHGHMFELYEPTDHLRGFYATVAAAAVDWNGSDPIR
jgi:catechol 2,3-dioxygenase-like lactoylglutathione lyase family enzyme